MSFKCVPIYGLMFRILTRFHALYFGASCILSNSIVWRRVNLARFPYWPEKRTRRISRYSYLMKTLISSEYDMTISGHVTVLRQWLSDKNTDYIIMHFILERFIFAIFAGTIKRLEYVCYMHFSHNSWCKTGISRIENVTNQYLLIESRN